LKISDSKSNVNVNVEITVLEFKNGKTEKNCNVEMMVGRIDSQTFFHCSQIMLENMMSGLI